MNELRILAGQIEVPAMRTGRDRDIHVERCAGILRRRLESAPADLVVLPELSGVDYSREAFERLDRLAEPLDGPSFRIYQALAARFRTTVAYGIARKGEGGYTITQAAVGPDGLLLGHYDKLHIAQFGASMEKEYFTRGSHLLVLEIGGFRVAPIICYDIRMPELCRTLAVGHGVDLILHCGAYYRDESFATWHPFAMTRALENQCFVLSLNRAGKDFGNSVLCPPWSDDGRPVESFDPHEEDIRHLVVGRQAMADARRQYSFLDDTLGDYGALECRVARA